MNASNFGFFVVFSFLAIAISTSATPAQSLHLSSEIVSQSKLEALTSEGWKFDRLAVVEQPEIVRWGGWAGILKQQAVWLSDGSWLVGELQIDQGQSLTVQNDWFSIPSMELSTVRGLVTSPPASPTKWSELQQAMQQASGEQDIVWLRSGPRISGIVRWTTSQAADRLVVESRNQNVEILLEDVKAIVFSPALLGPLATRAVDQSAIGFRDGSLLNTQSVKLKASRVDVQLSSGLEVRSFDSASDFAQAIVYLQGAPQGVSFLSDLELASYRNLSDNSLQWQLGRDRSVSGGPLRCREGFVAKGLALHSSAQVAYRWTGEPANFLAEVAMGPGDPLADARLGSVRCQVLLARGGALEKVREFDLSRADTQVWTVEDVEVDITGAQLIVLVVEKSDFGQYADQVFWLDARIAEPR